MKNFQISLIFFAFIITVSCRPANICVERWSAKREYTKALKTQSLALLSRKELDSQPVLQKAADGNSTVWPIFYESLRPNNKAISHLFPFRRLLPEYPSSIVISYIPNTFGDYGLKQSRIIAVAIDFSPGEIKWYNSILVWIDPFGTLNCFKENTFKMAKVAHEQNFVGGRELRYSDLNLNCFADGLVKHVDSKDEDRIMQGTVESTYVDWVNEVMYWEVTPNSSQS